MESLHGELEVAKTLNESFSEDAERVANLMTLEMTEHSPHAMEYATALKGMSTAVGAYMDACTGMIDDYTKLLEKLAEA